LQRLFSTFANGWPGFGLLLQRVLAGTMLVRFGIVQLTGASVSTSMISQDVIPQVVGACAGIFLFIGLWTPVVGTLIAVIELWIAMTQAGDPWLSIMLATIGGTAAMIGPGAWSIDARLFGRKHIET
jgi:putative oxidoreductase